MTYPWYLKFWVWWLGLTVVYLTLFLADFVIPAYALGLFVPYGILNGIALVNSIEALQFPPILTAVIFIAVLWSADILASNLRIKSPILKILYNLLLLLLLTSAVDFSIYGHWMSWHVLLDDSYVITD